MRNVLTAIIVFLTQGLGPAADLLFGQGVMKIEPHYQTVVHFDLDRSWLRASSTLSFAHGGGAEIQILLNRGLSLDSVGGMNVRGYRIDRFQSASDWNLISIELDPTSEGELLSLDLSFSGSPIWPSDGMNGIGVERVELSVDSQWHPLFASFDKELTGVLRVHLPKHWSVTASGSVSQEDGAFVIRNFVPQLDVAFHAASQMAIVSTDSVEVYHLPAMRSEAEALLEAAGTCRAYLNERFGRVNPLPPTKIALVDRSGPGYARKNYIVISTVGPSNLVHLHRFMCHELAHYWTRSAGPLTVDHWLTEAFAEHISEAFVRDQFGQDVYEGQVLFWAEALGTTGPVWTPQAEARGSGATMYRRGPYLLHLLEARIGRAAFNELVEMYTREMISTTAVLLDRLQDIAGTDDTAWFMDLLATQGNLPLGKL